MLCKLSRDAVIAFIFFISGGFYFPFPGCKYVCVLFIWLCKECPGVRETSI